mmetsp:Transcript_1392/g.2366  ORF Transcript_1392/g.2366 Transcript_1392/m.2366 type:complete len:200 (-) Transcript_1392:995-1594(-)
MAQPTAPLSGEGGGPRAGCSASERHANLPSRAGALLCTAPLPASVRVPTPTFRHLPSSVLVAEDWCAGGVRVGPGVAASLLRQRLVGFRPKQRFGGSHPCQHSFRDVSAPRSFGSALLLEGERWDIHLALLRSVYFGHWSIYRPSNKKLPAQNHVSFQIAEFQGKDDGWIFLPPECCPFCSPCAHSLCSCGVYLFFVRA